MTSSIGAQGDLEPLDTLLPVDSPEGSVPDRLLKAATTLFARKGFERASVAEIVEAAGVTKGALYHYVKSKDDLLYAIYTQVYALQFAHLQEFIEAVDLPIEERLWLAASDVVKTNLQFFDKTTIFLRSMHQLAEPQSGDIRKRWRVYHQQFRSLVEQGQSLGAFRDSFNPDLVVSYFFGAVQQLAVWWDVDGRLSAEEVGREYADMLLATLGTERPN